MVDMKSIDRLKEIKDEIDRLKTEKDILESNIIRECEKELANTKYKTLVYKTESGVSATVTLAETLRVDCPHLFKDIFGKAYPDMVEEKMTFTLTPKAKKLLINVLQDGYVRQTLDEAIEQLPVDDEVRKKLSKKLKGTKFDTDKKNLINIGGFSEKDASEYAYLLSEAAAWEQLETLLRLNNIDTEEKLKDLMKDIKAAMYVDETPKVSIG